MLRLIFSTAGTPIAQTIKGIMDKTAFTIQGMATTNPDSRWVDLPGQCQNTQLWGCGIPLWGRPLLSRNKRTIGVALSLFSYWNTDLFRMPDYDNGINQLYLAEQNFNLEVGMNYLYRDAFRSAHQRARDYKKLAHIGNGLEPADLFPFTHQIVRANNDPKFMLFEMPNAHNTNEIVGEFFPVYSSVILAKAALQGRPISSFGPLSEIFVDCIDKLTSVEETRIFEMRLQVWLYFQPNNGGGSMYNPVLQNGEQISAKFSCKV